jgi:ATP-dependent protease ClpP protease subunit
MAQTTLNIDAYIGALGYSKQWAKQKLAEAGTNPVFANISSLGGDIDHGLAIHDLFVDHGNVTARLSGFVASSATVIACGAKVVKMNSTAFYLVHKVSDWINEYGFKNEDEIQQLIEKFTQKAEENKKIDLVIAQIYAKRTGKEVSEIIDLMKKATWLTAEEAKEWGFVDEIVEMAGKINELTASKMAMIEAAGLPPVPRNPQKKINTAEETPNVIKTAQEILNNVKSLLKSQKSQKNNQMDKTKFSPLLNAVKVDNIELDHDGGCYMNATQLDAINAAIAKADKAESDRQAAEQARQTAETERDNIINSLDEIDETVKTAEGTDAKVAAIKTRIANLPGTPPKGNNGGDNKNDGVDWETINSLPHNKVADAEL